MMLILISLNIFIEIPKTDTIKYESSARDSSQYLLAPVVAMKAYVMEKIYGLKNRIYCLKNQLEDLF